MFESYRLTGVTKQCYYLHCCDYFTIFGVWRKQGCRTHKNYFSVDFDAKNLQHVKVLQYSLFKNCVNFAKSLEEKKV
jgi:hypothetical protein